MLIGAPAVLLVTLNTLTSLRAGPGALRSGLLRYPHFGVLGIMPLFA
jgi:hypothetical protein